MASKQTPIESGFNESSTAEEIFAGQDLKGKTATVMGGYFGLGLETTLVLAKAGAIVIVPARNVAKARTALDAIATVEHARSLS